MLSYSYILIQKCHAIPSTMELKICFYEVIIGRVTFITLFCCYGHSDVCPTKRPQAIFTQFHHICGNMIIARHSVYRGVSCAYPILRRYILQNQPQIMIIIIPTNINKEKVAFEYMHLYTCIYGDDGKLFTFTDTKIMVQWDSDQVDTSIKFGFNDLLKYNMKLLAMGCCDDIFMRKFSLSNEILWSCLRTGGWRICCSRNMVTRSHIVTFLSISTAARFSFDIFWCIKRLFIGKWFARGMGNMLGVM